MAWWYCKYGPSGITTVAMDGRDAVLEPVDVEQPLLQIHHIPAQGDQFRYTQPMAIREQ
jgi:hypothetical protein